MRSVLRDLNSAIASGRPCVFCTLIETRGSTPQKAGASMLVFPDGSQSGTLGGGCVEAEVKQEALKVLGSGQVSKRVLTFNLDDNYGWDDGLICGGRMTILADPIPGGHRSQSTDYYRRLETTISSGKGCTEAIVQSEQPSGLPVGSRYLFDAGGELLATTTDVPFPEECRELLKAVTSRPKPYAARGIAFLPHWPRITVLVVGGGHVGLAVARLAAETDFDVWVLDDREAFSNPERFPMAQRCLTGDIGDTLKYLVDDVIDPSFYCLIVTRGHQHDEEALFHLAESRAGYVGMIGSKRKIRLIYEDLLARGIPAEALARVHAPLGFDIGSQTVPEIAVSIVAELIACRNRGATIREARQYVEV